MNKIKSADFKVGLRFEFEKNWSRFLQCISEERIHEAEKSLREKLDLLGGKAFLDIGSGSGLFRLAPHRLDAKVTSFDFDVDSLGGLQLYPY